MNDVIKLLFKRKSVRQYEDRPIESDKEKIIIRSAIMAPTAGNQQMYTILKITDENLKKKLAEKCDNQKFINEAKLVLIFLADYQKWHDAFTVAEAGPRDVGMGDMMLAVDDALIAAENSVIAAESLGIGSCFIGDIMENCEEIRELLNLPEYVFPACMLVYGYPTESQKERMKPDRIGMEYIVQENRYKRYEAEDLYKMFSRDKEDFDKYMKAFCNRKYNSDFAIEMQRSVKKYMEGLMG